MTNNEATWILLDMMQKAEGDNKMALRIAIRALIAVDDIKGNLEASLFRWDDKETR